MSTRQPVSDTCPACMVGRLMPRRVTLARFYGRTLVHMPNVRAQVCDTCRLTIPDPGVLSRVDLLIGQSGPPPNRRLAISRDDAAPDQPATGPLPPRRPR